MARYRYPVDFQGEATRNLSVIDFVPSAGAFKATEMASRETIRRVYYGIQGPRKPWIPGTSPRMTTGEPSYSHLSLLICEGLADLFR